MDGGEEGGYELFGGGCSPCLLDHRGEDAVPAGGLDDGDVVGFLELADPAGNLHSGAKGHKQIFSSMTSILGAELLDAFVIFLVIGDFLADGETSQGEFSDLRNQLLTGVAQSAGRVAVRIDHQSVETEYSSPSWDSSLRHCLEPPMWLGSAKNGSIG